MAARRGVLVDVRADDRSRAAFERDGRDSGEAVIGCRQSVDGLASYATATADRRA
jgi:hypothetical protein